ncbi:bifunctional demethylmenaquinone methyltransferase/2-methoxy-6-polyprenyl-1,4-benzoquinol methylase UbiE [Geopsychrobacter electrodiphilus]|uniref:bifunctional demethylmenaquinone methyltransferase/2-methoxy-6-polyprenyl-1,4-benzoquinol methylase UbiE n=1 Tax=Geopsychrobacter electrodiphilus TaxID=225196 RepID=UPI00039EE2CD|nr:bifunctional demethylmenaquinone methyltransferase/2-methoxy-6-polyprenyl-1,4-benzoquinol methylase UbiE [Geopsychrobacter electrodiphilus]
MFELSDKGRGVRKMFDTIAPRYDLLNRLLSFGIDRRWRRFAVSQLHIPVDGRVLDIATGTCDVALEIAANTDASVRIVGEDFTQGMLVHGQKKLNQSNLGKRIMLVNAPCEAIPHPNCSFDAITIAFGIRNVVEREQGLREMLRVLKPGGRAVILEFSNPRSRMFRRLYYFYFRHLLPTIGGLFSQRSAYQYLPDSVLEFPSQENFSAMMTSAGFVDSTFIDLTFGIATVYIGDKA